MSNINVNNITPQTGTKVSVSGSLHASGDITANGNIRLGDANTDTIILSADISSSIIPVANVKYDLGEPYSQWARSYVSHSRVRLLDGGTGVDASRMVLVSGSIVPVVGDGGSYNLGATGLNKWNHIYVSESFVGRLNPSNEVSKVIHVSASLYPDGNYTYDLGKQDYTWNLLHSSASMTYRLGYKNPTTKGIEVSASLFPDRDSERDLGSTWNRWNDLYVDQVKVTDDLFVAGNISASALPKLNSAGDGGITDQLVQVSGSQLFSGSAFIGMSSTGFIQPWVSSSIFVFKA